MWAEPGTAAGADDHNLGGHALGCGQPPGCAGDVHSVVTWRGSKRRVKWRMATSRPLSAASRSPSRPGGVVVREDEVQWTAVRAQGAGGQNVNKVSSAVHLRFDIRQSSLPEAVKERLLRRPDQRINDEGVVVLKAQSHRTQERNRLEALARLQALVDEACHVPKARKATRPTWGSQQQRLSGKAARGTVKAGRGRVVHSD